MKSVKLQKQESHIKHLLGEAFTNSNNDSFQFVSVTDVDLTSDFSFVTIYVSDLNNNDNLINELNKNKKYFRAFLSKLQIRKIPEPIFKWDDSINYANKIEKIINEL